MITISQIFRIATVFLFFKIGRILMLDEMKAVLEKENLADAVYKAENASLF